MSKDKVTIKIPRELYQKLKELIKDTGFSSVTEFVVFTMRMIVAGGRIAEESKSYGKAVKEVKERLRRLGYIE